MGGGRRTGDTADDVMRVNGGTGARVGDEAVEVADGLAGPQRLLLTTRMTLMKANRWNATRTIMTLRAGGDEPEQKLKQQPRRELVPSTPDWPTSGQGHRRVRVGGGDPGANQHNQIGLMGLVR